MKAVRFEQNRLFYLDQRQLPLKEVWRECKNLKEGFTAIKELSVRGAPLIGVFAAYCVCVVVKKFSLEKNSFLEEVREAVEYLKTSRPTAVNLFWALDRIEKAVFDNKEKPLQTIKTKIINEAKTIHKQDINLCRNMAEYGIKLIKKGDRILTHCNAGALATGGEGTALGVIYRASKVYKDIKVYADETRPLLQGARLTAWELGKNNVDCTVICDNMAASLMREKKVDKIFVGADRIAANGDTANKIGTYSLAIVAGYHKIPFYVVAPFSTFDLTLSAGSRIPIEQRPAIEVRTVLNKHYIAPKNIKVYNPAFDVTPNKLITAIVSDKGIIYPPFKKNIKKSIVFTKY